eukprot:tig00020704_g13157.t1
MAASAASKNAALVATFKILVPVALVLGVTVVGGAIISAAEAPVVSANAAAVLRARDQLRSLNLTDAQLSALVRFARELSRAADLRAALDSGGTPSEWSLLGGSFFTATLGSGIGYGNYSPQNSGGRAFTVLWGLFALLMYATLIPRVAALFLAPLCALNARLLLPPRAAEARERPGPAAAAAGRGMEPVLQPSGDRVGTKATSREQASEPDPEHGKLVKFLAVLQGLLAVWLGGTAIMGRIEGWDYGTSLYWGFSTLTTIGLGDIVPASDPGRTFFFFYAVLSLGLFAAMVEIVTGWIKSLEDGAAEHLASWAAACADFLRAGRSPAPRPTRGPKPHDPLALKQHLSVTP